MPEGNTIHRLAREHTRDFVRRLVRVSSPQGRFAGEARRLDGRRFRAADAVGKHLFHLWEGGLIVHVHLGMAGEFYRFAGPPPEPRPTVRMRLSTPAVTTDLIGPPTCELIDEAGRAAILARLGPDPLRRGANPMTVFESLYKRPDRPIGDALLDQRVISGVGNIYRIEALFLAGIHPLTRSRRISPAQWLALWELIRDLMRRGATRRRISTVDPSEVPHPAAGRGGRDPFYVYQHEICRRCGSRIREIPLSGRRMFFCATCQRKTGGGRR
ncbi:MAG: Fpg/Nei family DNA glycosylase [Acidobacteria bacterium]|nr:Fpg/Nei family DNA glycosylase [Acidobacteriota bacterium]MCA1609277.1 Fpg/Nei family DNA glycosylase [Acidobacteriota bacterium]